MSTAIPKNSVQVEIEMSSLFEVDGGLTLKLLHVVFKIFMEHELLKGIETEQYLVTKVNNLIKLAKDAMSSHIIIHKRPRKNSIWQYSQMKRTVPSLKVGSTNSIRVGRRLDKNLLFGYQGSMLNLAQHL